MSDLISKRELYRKIAETYNSGRLSWGANEIFKDIIGECDSVENKGEPCDDCISRKAVLELATPVDSMYADITVEMISADDIRKLPSVQPIIPNMTITVYDSYMRNVRRDCGLYE